ncbi:MAG: hypothetical protein U0800_11945 [Isosphaeraceae bacterium]
MAADTQRLTPQERENLVAYLDGELSDQESRAMALKLTNSVGARRDVAGLMAAWDLLDHLPRPDAPPDFSEKTLSVALELGQGVDQQFDMMASWGIRLVRWGLAALAMVLAVVAGFVVAAWVVPSPTGRLARQLSIAENLAEYQAVGGDFEFLRRLDELPEFNVAPD